MLLHDALGLNFSKIPQTPRSELLEDSQNATLWLIGVEFSFMKSAYLGAKHNLKFLGRMLGTRSSVSWCMKSMQVDLLAGNRKWLVPVNKTEGGSVCLIIASMLFAYACNSDWSIGWLIETDWWHVISTFLFQWLATSNITNILQQMLAHQTKNSPHFTEAKGLFLHAQDPTCGPCPEPAEFLRHARTLFPHESCSH